MNADLYMKLKIKDVELSPLELEKTIYRALKEHIGRDLDFPQEDIVVTPVEFYVGHEEYLKKVIEYLFSEVVSNLKEVKDDSKPFRDYVSIDDLIDVYSNWNIDTLIKSLKVNIKGN